MSNKHIDMLTCSGFRQCSKSQELTNYYFILFPSTSIVNRYEKYLFGWWRVALSQVCATFKEVFFNLLEKILARTRISHIEPVFIN